MLPAMQYRKILLQEFYLDTDDITIRRKKDGYYNRFKKDDIVKPYTYRGNSKRNYQGIHIPRTRTTISLPWLLTVLRDIPFKDGQIIDHIDGDITNNSRQNLRVTSQRINSCNCCKRKDNTSGYTGIHYNKKANIYIIRKSINKKRVYHSSKTLQQAIMLLQELEQFAKADGYTKRHGKETSTTILKRSTLQAIGSGSA